MTTTIFFIRHGQTDWNRNGRWQGHTDVPLNETGKAQAQAVARRLAAKPIHALYSSDLQRARMTAVPIADALNLEPIYDPVWRERHVGDFSGLTTPEIMDRFPEMRTHRLNRAVEPPNGERYTDLYRRATGAYDALRQRHAGDMVAVVSHGGAIGVVISHVLGIPQEQFGRFSLRGNTGVSIVEISEQDGPRVVLLNDTCHLEH